MSKSTGLGAQLFHNGYDVTNDIKSVDSIRMPSGLLDKTGIDKSAIERIFGLRDGEITVTAHFNDAAGFSHPVFKALPRTDVHQMYCHRATLAAPACAHIGKQINYDPVRSADGDLVSQVQVLSNLYPVEWGKLLTAGKVNATGIGNTTGVDFGSAVFAGSSTLGLAAYLVIFAFTGTDVTIRLQESTDDAAADPYANVTGGAFTQITTSPVVERIETSLTQTVERYLRLNLATTGGFTSIDYAVMVVRYDGANRES